MMSDRERQILCDITHMWSLQNNTSGSTQNRNRPTDIEKKLMVTKRERYGGESQSRSMGLIEKQITIHKGLPWWLRW